MQASIDLLEDQARALRAEGQWTFADHLESAIAEIKDNRAAKVSGNGTREAASLARKYDWISRQDDGAICAADVAHDIRESFGITTGGNGLADERVRELEKQVERHKAQAQAVFNPAITLPDPYDERPGPWYDMQKVRVIEAETGVSFDGECRWAVYRREIMWLRSENKRLQQAVKENMVSAIKDIAAERRRQIEEEGWTHEHDDVHGNEELASAAVCYALPRHLHGDFLLRSRNAPRPTSIRAEVWPWTRAWWKPKDRRRDLVRAGALIVAEIDRLDRESTLNDAAGDEPRLSLSTRYDE